MDYFYETKRTIEKIEQFGSLCQYINKNLCSENEWKSYEFVTKWWWVNDGRI